MTPLALSGLPAPAAAALADGAAALADALAAWLWRATWQGALVAAAVALVVALAGRRLSPAWRFGLWSLVLVRLALPTLVTVEFDAPAAPSRATPAPPGPGPLRLAALPPATSPPSASARLELPATLTGNAAPSDHASPSAPAGSSPTSPGPAARSPDRAPGLAVVASPAGAPAGPLFTRADGVRAALAVWLAGVLVFAARVATASLRVARAVRRLEVVRDPRLLGLLDRCRRDLGLRAAPEVRRLPRTGAPALVGFLRPRLLLPTDALAALDDRELSWVLLHELAHVRRRDVLVNWLATLVVVVHWFNPLAWVALWRMRAERELACDQTVLRLAGIPPGVPAGDPSGPAPDEPARAYALTLLKLVETLSGCRADGPDPAARLPADVAVPLVENKAQIQRRLLMISRFDRSGRRATALGLALALSVGSLALIGAVRAAEKPKPAEPRNGEPPSKVDPALPAPAPLERPSASAPRAGSEVGAPGAPLPPPVAPAAAKPTAPPRAPAPADARPADPEEQKANARAYEKLKKPIKADFADAALSEVLDVIRDAAEVDMVIEWSALEGAGIEKATRVSLKLREPYPADTVLSLVLRPITAARYQVEKGVVVVTTADRAPALVTRAYDVSDLVGPATAPAMMGAGGMPGEGAVVGAAPGAAPGGGGFAAGGFGGGGAAPGMAVPVPAQAAADPAHLVMLVTSTVEPAGWMNAGGQYTINVFRGKLVVKAPEAVHKEITDLLDMLREAPKARH